MAQFEQDQWSASAAPQLYQPAISNGVRVARRIPIDTSDATRSSIIDRLVPNSGDFYNGMVTYTDTPQKNTPSKPRHVSGSPGTDR